jgi:hypothetical protein
LPDPVSPHTTTTGCSASARPISARRAETGSDAGNSIAAPLVGGAPGVGLDLGVERIGAADYSRRVPSMCMQQSWRVAGTR